MASILQADLKNPGRAFTWPELSTRAGLGSFIGSQTSLPSVHEKVLILFTTLIPQEHQHLKSDHITLHVTKLGPKKIVDTAKPD